MTSNADRSRKELHVEVLERIEAQCRAFEKSLKDRSEPKIEDYLPGRNEVGRSAQLFELLCLEIEYRIAHQRAVTKDELLRRFREDAAVVQDAVALYPDAFDSSVARQRETIEHKTEHEQVRGLHIRCPHCSNFVEVITDTPFEEIYCSTCGSSFSLVDREDATRYAAPLNSISRFDLVTRLGFGGFGTVWKAHDRELDRTVAIKIPRRRQLAPQEIDQFFREARAAAQLRHSNIVAVHEVGREGESFFIVSDFVRGVTLSDWLTANPISAREVAELCIPIADALHHAHQQGVVHRDLKPSNILIDASGQPHLTDFGLAKREVGEITMTKDGQVLGTPGYMSPEQARGMGHWTDRRTDIYSLGVILFRLLTDELPFRGNAQMQIQQRLTEDAPDPREFNRHIPRDLATICLKCLETEPGRRYATAAELRDELGRYLRGEPIRARPISRAARLVRWGKRKPWVAMTAVLTTFLATAGPIAAVSIESQRRQLVVRYRERDAFVESSKQTIDAANGKIGELEHQLAAWDGKAHPTEFWPPCRSNQPRQMLIADLFVTCQANLLTQLHAESTGLEPMARGYMALGAMAESVGKRENAIEYFEAAERALQSLRNQQPAELRYSRALALCQDRIADLEPNGERAKAMAKSSGARELYQRIAAQNASELAPQIEWLEAELKSTLWSGYDRGQQHLAQTEQIKNKLHGLWPRDPDVLYQVTCFLLHQEPLLLLTSKDSVSTPTKNPTTPSTR